MQENAQNDNTNKIDGGNNILVPGSIITNSA